MDGVWGSVVDVVLRSGCDFLQHVLVNGWWFNGRGPADVSEPLDVVALALATGWQAQ